MIADRSSELTGFDRRVLKTAQILLRAAIALQIWRLQSASRIRRPVIAAALGLIGLCAGALGLILQAARRITDNSATCGQKNGELRAFEGGVAAFANATRTGGSSMIREHL